MAVADAVVAAVLGATGMFAVVPLELDELELLEDEEVELVELVVAADSPGASAAIVSP